MGKWLRKSRKPKLKKPWPSELKIPEPTLPNPGISEKRGARHVTDSHRRVPWLKKSRSKSPESPVTPKAPTPPEPTLPNPGISEKYGARHIIDRR